MAIERDFTWAEMGERIRVRRIARAISQQALALDAGLTQNGVFRLEAGETNPQLSSLQRVATALGCTVRELLSGAKEPDVLFGDRYQRVRRVLESDDDAAIQAMDGGIAAAEALLDRATRQRPIRIKGEGQHSSPVGSPIPLRGLPKTPLMVGGMTVFPATKAPEAFVEPRTTYDTKNKNKRV